jgi:hypothetical protein
MDTFREVQKKNKLRIVRVKEVFREVFMDNRSLASSSSTLY